MRWLSPWCVLLVLAAGAQAQTAQMPLVAGSRVGITFSPVQEVTDSEQAATRLALLEEAALAVHQTLRRMGYEVLDRAQVIAALLQASPSCGGSSIYECNSDEIRGALGLDGVVMVSVWTAEVPVQISIEVTLAEGCGEGRAPLERSVQDTVPELLSLALHDTAAARPVQLQIHTLPTRSEVTVDGQYVGTSPLTTAERFVPGHHEVTVTRPGYLTTTQHVQVPRGGADPMQLYLQAPSLEARDSLQETDTSGHSAPFWDYLVGVTLGLAAVPLLVVPSVTAARDDECKEPMQPDGTCEQVQFGTASSVLLATGVVAALGSAAFFVFKPISTSLSVNGDHVYVQARARF
jgi:hypothetical protein